MRQMPFTPRKIPDTQGRIRSIENSSNLIGIQTCDLPASTIVPQLTMLVHASLGSECQQIVACE
jgi:hypothetical protein